MVLVSLSHFLICANLWVLWVGLGYLTPQSELDKGLKFTSPWTQQSVVGELDLQQCLRCWRLLDRFYLNQIPNKIRRLIMLTGRPRSLCSVFSERKLLSQHFTLSLMQKSKMKL